MLTRYHRWILFNMYLYVTDTDNLNEIIEHILLSRSNGLFNEVFINLYCLCSRYKLIK
jgi:hypothetical protein